MPKVELGEQIFNSEVKLPQQHTVIIFEILQTRLEAYLAGVLAVVEDFELRVGLDDLCRPEVDLTVVLQRLQVLILLAEGALNVRHPVQLVLLRPVDVEENLASCAQLWKSKTWYNVETL